MVADKTAEEPEEVEFSWHCEKGLAENIAKVKYEFFEKNDLKPIRIFITGPPLAGKTYFGDKLCEEYNIPHIKIKDLIIEAEHFTDAEEDELAQDIHRLITEFRTHDKISRYPDEILCNIVRRRLNQNDCQHRGFVLDGFPRTYENAKEIFMWAPAKKEKSKPEGEGEGEEEPAEEEDEEEAAKYKPKFQQHIYPDSVIFL